MQRNQFGAPGARELRQTDYRRIAHYSRAVIGPAMVNKGPVSACSTLRPAGRRLPELGRAVVYLT
jgi:hypothetical protein